MDRGDDTIASKPSAGGRLVRRLGELVPIRVTTGLGEETTHILVNPFRRLLFFMVMDGVFVTIATYIAFNVRFLGFTGAGTARLFYAIAGTLVLLNIAVLYALDVYRSSWRFFGLRDTVRVGAAVAVSTITVATFVLVFHGAVSVDSLVAILLIQAPFTFVALSGFRLSKRIARLFQRSDSGQTNAAPALLIGAGDVGEQVLRSLQTGPERDTYYAAAFLDNDPHVHGMEIHGVPVVGPIDDLESWIRHFGAELVVLCTEDIEGPFLQDVVRRARQAGAESVRTIPPHSRPINQNVSFEQTRQAQLEDLFRREPIDISGSDIKGLIAGKRVLVSGAAGTIGSELSRQIDKFGPEHLTIVDTDESRLHEVYRELQDNSKGVEVTEALVDIRDERQLRTLFEACGPDLVFHAAAYKHVPLLQSRPCTALDVNVLGTVNLLELADAYGVDHFVFISTDKAVEPANVMGATKRLAEDLVYRKGMSSDMECALVRFGNVLGSRGSVVPIFERQLETGGPLTVTHPDVERYFMTTFEAVALVLQAASLNRGSEIFVLDMGEPIKIVDLAEKLIRLWGFEPHDDIPIVFTGLRPGETLTEELIYETEEAIETDHPRILRIDPNGLSEPDVVETVESIVERGDGVAAHAFLESLFDSYTADVVQSEQMT